MTRSPFYSQFYHLIKKKPEQIPCILTEIKKLLLFEDITIVLFSFIFWYARVQWKTVISPCNKNLVMFHTCNKSCVFLLIWCHTIIVVNCCNLIPPQKKYLRTCRKHIHVYFHYLSSCISVPNYMRIRQCWKHDKQKPAMFTSTCINIQAKNVYSALI